jgi:predicted alpha-1,2-mannosidase
MTIRLNAATAALAAATLGVLGLGGTASAAPPASVATPTNLARLADPLTWTSGGGNTFPGADVPFGMVQWSPDVPGGGAGGGYDINATSLMGFGLTHVSGPGCGAAGDVPILPTTGALPSGDPNSVTTPLSHQGEVAQAGYYSLNSNQPNTINSQFTATEHSSMAQFTYPKTTSAGVLIKLMDSQNGDDADTGQVVGNNEVMGSDTSGNFCGETNNGGQPQLYTVYFDIVFSQAFTASHVITNSGQTDPAAVFLTFNTTSNPVIEAKVGISYVSTANAKLNWQTDNPAWNFDSVRSAAQASWNSLLGRIKVSGGSAAQTQEFYSLLYKDFLQPNVTSDVNGQFMGSDLKVHTVATGQQNQYGMYSGWDTYHSLSQLQAMLDPVPASDMAQSQLNYYAENGLLQQWGYLNLDNYVMVGDPSQSIIADIYAFGGRSFNTSEALTDMLAQATTVNDVRPGEAMEQKYGYLPQDASYGCCNFHGTVATLLEDDNADMALSFFAAALGDQKDSSMLEQRANNWANLFDPSDGLLNARTENGQFVSGITPAMNDSAELYYVEGDPYEYLWDVPNDYAGLFAALGGDAKVVPALKTYLSQPNGYGMYAELSNEFDMGEQFALDYAGDPAGTQQVVNNIRNTMYLPGPSGLDNNDDLGAGSSQFIWEMLGMYPENPGSDTLVFASPGFPHAQITLPSGHTIVINAPGASPSDYYVQSLDLNSHPYQQLSVPFSTLAAGATLSYRLGTHPSTWGSAPQDTPPSYTAGLNPVASDTSSSQVTVAPGGSSTVAIGAQNLTNTSQTVHASVTAPAGVTVTPASGTIHVPPHGRGTLTLRVSAAASTPQNFSSMPISLSDGSTTLRGMTVTMLVAASGSLLRAFDNAGVSNDSDVTGANFDGGGASYSAQALAAAGVSPGSTVTVGGITYTWPPSTPGYPDNSMADGQRVTIDAPAGTREVGFLGAAADGPSQGIVTLRYSDGSASKYWLGLSDWTLNGGGASAPSYGNQIAAATTYRNCSYCSPVQQTVKTYLFSAAVPVRAGKTLVGVTLPTGATQGTLHIFAIGTSSHPATPPDLVSITPRTAAAGAKVTIHGSGFGSSQGGSYVGFSDGGVTWAPGTVDVDSWSNTAIGFTVPTPSGTGGSIAVYPGSAAMVTVNVVASGTTATSNVGVLNIAPSSDQSAYFNNDGISADADQTCGGTDAANYDGDGYAYSSDALAKAGLTPGSSVTADGLNFTWPNVQPCNVDNILAEGQTMLMSGTGNTLGFLGSSTNGTAAGSVVIHYTDGTSSTATLSLNDWAQGPGSGDTSVAAMTYRNSTDGSQTINMWVYAASVPVESGKTVASITFPDISNTTSNGAMAMHIFAVALGTT